MATSISIDPWSVARARYLRTLTDDQKHLFTHASLENVLYTTTAEQRSYQNDSRSVALATKLKPFLDAVGDYGAALDVYSNACPLIMCPLWGSIRVLLHIAREFQSYYEKLVDMFVTIGEVLPTFRVYEKIFSGHQALLYALSELYLDIIKFCIDAKDIFNKARLKKGLHAIQIRILWRPFDRQFGEVVENFRRHQKKVETQASLAHMIEAANEREAQLIKRTQAQQEESRQIAVHKKLKRLQVLKRLSNIDHESRHRQLRKMRCKNTGNWIFSTKQYMEWIAKDESCCFWCYGIPGSGKSIITTAVVDRLAAGTSGSGSLVAVYFYCDYSNSSTLEVSGILENFILQLLSRTSEIPDDIQSTVLAAYDGVRKPDAEELLDILLLVIKLFDKVFFILDGVDECAGSDRAGLLAVIQSITKPGPATVKLFLASRADFDLGRTLKDCICLPISAGDITADIGAFVNDIIEEKIASRDLVVRNQALVGEILDALVNGAEGMFLWVTFQIEDICEASCDKEIRTVLGNLPVGLAETYARALRKIHTKNPGATQLTQKIFKWMVCARRPLVIDEIKEAISISPRDKSLEPDKITTDDSRIIRACANLAIFDSDERTFRFAHYSVQEFLLRSPVGKNITDIHFRLPDAEREVGEICLTYLTFSRFGTQVKVLSEAPDTDLGLLASSFLFRDSWFGKVAFGAWARFRGRKSSQFKLSINWGEYLKQTPHTLPSPEFEQQYRLLNYVIENWAWHTIKFSGTNTKLWSIFKSLALEQQLPFSFRPWGDIGTAKDFPYMPMVSWAIDTGHEPLLRLLSEPPRGYSLGGYLEQQVTEEDGSTLLVLALHRSAERGYDACVKLLLETENVQSHDKVTALHLAAEKGYDSCVKLLLEGGADPNATNPYQSTALHLAAERGYDRCVKLLLEGGADLNAMKYGSTALHLAVGRGYDPCVKLLLEGGADPNATNPYQSTALHLAAERGYYRCVKLVLEGGADPNAMNYESTALRLAVRRGYDSCVKLLLEGGADPNAMNYGSTALSLAVGRGYYPCVKLLLEGGADPNATDNGGIALHLAAERGYNRCVKLLLERGADPNATNLYQNAALYLATAGGYDSCVKLLLEGGANPNSTGYGGTALHLAAEKGYDTCVKLLLQGGVNPNALKCLNTALHLAASNGRDAVIELLLEGGADPNVTNLDRRTALHKAADHGKDAVVKLLLEGGANPGATDNNHDTALHLAAYRGSDACVKLLLRRGANLGALNNKGETALDLAANEMSDACIKLLQEAERC